MMDFPLQHPLPELPGILLCVSLSVSPGWSPQVPVFSLD